ncbi:hypothetical protein, partial [Corallococcus exiguus]|uniref:hypothetical protein n=1 Tax=Corallococcus exiguus TaxID=83462 RepID=UPI001560B03D
HPFYCAVRFNNVKIFEFFFSLYEKFFKNDEILYLKDEDGNNFLHIAAAFAKSRENFELAWTKIKNLFKEEEKLKSFLLLKGKFGNALLRSITERNENSFFFLFEEVYCKFFTLQELIQETDKNGENFVHKLARWGPVLMLKFAFEKLKKELKSEEFKN